MIMTMFSIHGYVARSFLIVDLHISVEFFLIFYTILTPCTNMQCVASQRGLLTRLIDDIFTGEDRSSD